MDETAVRQMTNTEIGPICWKAQEAFEALAAAKPDSESATEAHGRFLAAWEDMHAVTQVLGPQFLDDSIAGRADCALRNLIVTPRQTQAARAFLGALTGTLTGRQREDTRTALVRLEEVTRCNWVSWLLQLIVLVACAVGGCAAGAYLAFSVWSDSSFS